MYKKWMIFQTGEYFQEHAEKNKYVGGYIVIKVSTSHNVSLARTITGYNLVERTIVLREAKLFKMIMVLIRTLWPLTSGHFIPDYSVTTFNDLKSDQPSHGETHAESQWWWVWQWLSTFSSQVDLSRKPFTSSFFFLLLLLRRYDLIGCLQHKPTIILWCHKWRSHLLWSVATPSETTLFVLLLSFCMFSGPGFNGRLPTQS